MMRMGSRLLIGLSVAAALCAPALAQRSGYPVKQMNFDLWCQEQARLPVARCDKRTPEDQANFQAYRAKVEAYEIPYLQRKDSAARLDRDLLRPDPVDSRRTQPPDPNSSSTATPPR